MQPMSWVLITLAIAGLFIFLREFYIIDLRDKKKKQYEQEESKWQKFFDKQNTKNTTQK